MNNKNKRKNRRLKITKARKTLALILMASKLKIKNKLNKLKQ
jgi:Fe2+ or Zn2+ uptake regulation protein